MKQKSKRIALAVLLALAATSYALLLWRGPWWFDGNHLRTKDLQPADGVVITGFRTTLVAVGAGVVAALGLYYTHKGHKQTESLFLHTRDKDRELYFLWNASCGISKKIMLWWSKSLPDSFGSTQANRYRAP
ncbi:hypothetical protein [Streptomyces sp. NPDC058812]|uniref:hypothetical protein n=1 Tax=unclassified Streptomyces TaxID=2593676 RepID=UPI003684DD34